MNRITTPAIDFAAKTITCSKKFLKKAREVNSDEYRLMLQITSDLPAFMIVIKEAVTPVRRNIQPTYTAMAEYIRCMDHQQEQHPRLLLRRHRRPAQRDRVLPEARFRAELP